MAWNPNIPLATDFPSTSQQQINDNWTEIDTLVSFDHITFGLGNTGKHNRVTMPRVTGGVPAPAAQEIALYNNLSTLSAQSELSIRRGTGGAITEFTSALSAANGWTRLPSGILLKWGTGNANGVTAINFPVAATIPVFANVFTAQVTTTDIGGAVDADEFVYVTNISITQLTLFGAPRTTTGTKATSFYYLVIGN